MFHWSNYWGTWSRVLWAKDGYFIELNITPVGGSWKNDKGNLTKEGEKVSMEVVRFHCTPRGRMDKIEENLPLMVIVSLSHNLGDDLANRLLTHNYLEEVTPEEIKTACNHSNGGGVPLQFVKDYREKGGFWIWR